MAYCADCGKELPKDASFCPSCGAKLAEAPTSGETVVIDNANEPREGVLASNTPASPSASGVNYVKKHIVAIISIVATLVLVIGPIFSSGFAGGIVGTWYASNDRGDYATLTFKSDGTGSMGFATGDTHEHPFEWVKEGNTIRLTNGKSSLGSAEIASDGSKIVYRNSLAESAGNWSGYKYSNVYCKNKADAEAAYDG